jgi:hypothetical protein
LDNPSYVLKKGILVVSNLFDIVLLQDHFASRQDDEHSVAFQHTSDVSFYHLRQLCEGVDDELVQLAVLGRVLEAREIAQEGIEVLVVAQVVQKVGLEKTPSQLLLDLGLDDISSCTFGVPVSFDDIGQEN